ncbi:hypothetical protein KCP75_19810 [Salmonella enterica subsp. enterica]|nr:hypothetical protein KCP75_19810 [Salmonella enterica subsp. enterica]
MCWSSGFRCRHATSGSAGGLDLRCLDDAVELALWRNGVGAYRIVCIHIADPSPAIKYLPRSLGRQTCGMVTGQHGRAG